MFKNSNRQLRCGWNLLFLYLTVYILLFGLSFVLTSIEAFDSANELTQNIFLSIVQVAVFIAVPYVAWRKFCKMPTKEFGVLSRTGPIKEPAIGLVYGLGAMVGAFGLICLFGGVTSVTWKPRLSADALIILILYIISAFSEEYLCRGYVMKAIERTGNRPVVVLFVSSAIFSIMHVMNDGVTVLALVNLFLFGCITGLMTLMTGNISMAVGFHIAWNYIQYLLGFQVSGTGSESPLFSMTLNGRNLVNGGTFGPEGGYCVTAAIILAVVIYASGKKKKV